MYHLKEEAQPSPYLLGPGSHVLHYYLAAHKGTHWPYEHARQFDCDCAALAPIHSIPQHREFHKNIHISTLAKFLQGAEYTLTGSSWLVASRLMVSQNRVKIATP